MVKDITDQNFEDEVLKSDLPVVLDFWAPWCGPCRTIAPITEKLAEEYKEKIKFCKLNVDEYTQMAGEYQVVSIPLLLFFQGGQMVEERLGAVSESVIKSKIEALV